jgi:guanylate kinase
MPHETFMEKVRNGEFVEWEEVYKDHYYGTLKKEVERIRNKGTNVIFDIDVLGGLNLKRFYGKAALAIFVMPPSLEELSKRLINRSLDEDEKIRMRIEKAESELQYAHKFDCILYNNELDEAVDKAYKLVKNFLQK